MKVHFYGFKGVLVLVVLNSLATWGRGEFIPADIDRKIEILNKVINYVRHRPNQITIDTIFGITLTQANIVATLLHENAEYLGEARLEALTSTLITYDETRRHLKAVRIPQSKNDWLFNLALNNPEIWIRDLYWRNISDNSSSFNPQLNQEEILEFTMEGVPKEDQSDHCLSELIQERLKGTCEIPDFCMKMLTNTKGARGYPLTHRLLITQTGRTFGCEEEAAMEFSSLSSLYCLNILRDLGDIEAADFPYYTRDLMMEQVVLCGMEGFLEFLKKSYEDKILSWYHPTGCFSPFLHPTLSRGEKLRVERRSSLPMDFGCDSHTTGLGAATLSLFIRHSVETALGSQFD